MSNDVLLDAEDLNGYLTNSDHENINKVEALYNEYIEISKAYLNDKSEADNLSLKSKEIGALLKNICKDEDQINIYSFKSPKEQHAGVSRLIAKLRKEDISHEEFLYYIQRAYEILFEHIYCDKSLNKKRSLIQPTPVDIPTRAFAVHRIPDVDSSIENAVMCVMLRGALLPSMIISKEIQDYSSTGYITPFALFKISRNDKKSEKNMQYALSLDKSFFDLSKLNGKDLVFADPMNATGGSLITIVKYLESINIIPKSITFINVLSTLKGALRISRALPNCNIYTLWMDPVMNEKAYILPGLGDAGDKLNKKDDEDHPRNIIQLLADYGQGITNLYRSQVREIENTVLPN